MLPFFTSTYGNPASRDHPQGWIANEAIRSARCDVAQLIGANPDEVTFTSGATESINLLLRGLPPSQPGLPILTLNSEHAAVVETCRALERSGTPVKWIGVDSGGRIDLEAWEKALQAGAQLAVVLWVNNETGVMQDMEAIGQLCHQYEVPLFTDATQAAGKLNIDLDPYIDYACFSAHKIHGPKGIGALYIRQGKRSPLPLLTGGGILAEDLIMAVNHRLAISTGSACNSVRVLPSHVLLAMGRSETEAFSSLRFSLGRHTTEEEIETALQTMTEAVRNLA
ncbi:UNVERIFIED_CONTAM: hypothetical protein GTU68_057402 [Idotea baltica]|nr:hypothetical protein [Idotea baltica]